MLTLHSNSPAFIWLEKNITKTHAIDIHTLEDGKFVTTLVASGDVAAS